MFLIPVNLPSSEGFAGKKDLAEEERHIFAEIRAPRLFHLQRLFRQPELYVLAVDPQMDGEQTFHLRTQPVDRVQKSESLCIF